MKIKWGWDDGYAGRRPSMTLEIDDEDLEGLSPQQQDKIIDERVQEEFQNRVTTHWERAE